MPEEIKKFEISNRLFWVVLIFLIGLLILWGMWIFVKFKNLPDNYPREIVVSGEGRAFAVPDIAVVKLGVTTEGTVIKEVVKINTEKMAGILKEIKDLGIENKDIQTSNYSLTPRYEWTKEGQRIFKGYVLNQDIRVKIRDFEKIGSVLEKSIEKGANLVGDLQFSLDDIEMTKEAARKEAIEKARAKAEQIARQSGLRLIKVVNVSEDFYPAPVLLERYGIGGGAMTEKALPAPEIRPGEQEVVVRINLTYKVR